MQMHKRRVCLAGPSVGDESLNDSAWAFQAQHSTWALKPKHSTWALKPKHSTWALKTKPFTCGTFLGRLVERVPEHTIGIATASDLIIAPARMRATSPFERLPHCRVQKMV